MSIKKFKNGCSRALGVLLLGGLLVCNSTQLYATDLNGIGVQTQQTQQTQQVVENNTNNTTQVVENTTQNATNSSNNMSNAEAVGSLFENLGPTNADFEKANQILRPFVEFINFFIALALGVLSALLLVITMIDLFYICVPIIRKWLDGGRSQQQGGSSGGGMGMSGGMGMGGYGHGGMGMGGSQPSQAQAFCGQWVSDEAIVTFNECNPQQGGGGMSGGMGMGMGGMQQSQPTASKKVMLMTYAKKRIVFLFMFGMCIVLLITTTFTELGVNAGVWLLGKISGLM